MISTEWGEDPTKPVITKSRFGGGWILWPPHDSDPCYFPTFEDAVAAIW